MLTFHPMASEAEWHGLYGFVNSIFLSYDDFEQFVIHYEERSFSLLLSCGLCQEIVTSCLGVQVRLSNISSVFSCCCLAGRSRILPGSMLFLAISALLTESSLLSVLILFLTGTILNLV